MLGLLTEAIQELDNVPESTKTSLLAPLRQASALLTDDNPANDVAVCGQLNAVLNQINARERSRLLSAEQAHGLGELLREIRAKLGC
jgi:hypothetical protein